MSEIPMYNLKVMILDSDFYALQAINSYLAWDRRTRVTYLTTSLNKLMDELRETSVAELPDVIVMDVDHLGEPAQAQDVIHDMQRLVPEVMVICMAQSIRIDLIDAVAEAGAQAYLLKEDVRMQIAWAICYAVEKDFVITHGVARLTAQSQNRRVYNATVLPEQRDYPEMTQRVRQAIRLCVVEGMPAHLAADEMGISLHTVRGYIKEGYRILESYDNADYPTDMTPQERAFMRFTALASEE